MVHIRQSRSDYILGFQVKTLKLLPRHSEAVCAEVCYRATSLIRDRPPRRGHHIALGICCYRVLGGGDFLQAWWPVGV